MLHPPSKEAIAAFIDGDAGFREFLATLPETERDNVVRLIQSPELFYQILSILPPDQQSATYSLLDDFFNVPEKALKLYKQCRFLEARELLKRTIDLFDMSSGMPANALVNSSRFVAQRANALNHDLLGDIEQTLGNIRLAGEHHHHALLLARECGDRETEAKAHYGLGCYYWHIGDYEQALEYSRSALDLLGEGPDRWFTKSKVLNSLFLIHGELSQWDLAVEFCEKAFAVAEESEDVKALPIILNNLSVQLMAQGRLDEVEPLLRRALTIALEQSEPRQEAMTRTNLGMFYLNSAEADEDISAAITEFKEALGISRRVDALGLEALACSGMGHALVMTEDINGAEEQFRRAVDCCRSISAIADCSDVLVELGNLLRYCRHLPDESLACYDEAITMTEQVRSKLKRETHRIGLAESRTEPYHQAIITLLELGRSDEAFHYLERARSKALLELLSGQFSVESESGPFREAAELAARIKELRNALDEIHRVDETGSDECSEDETCRRAMRSELQQGLEEEERQFANICEELQRVSPERHGMVALQATDSLTVRAQLAPGSALLEFYQTGELLLVFIIRPEQPVRVVEVQLTAEAASEIVFSLIMALRDPTSFDVRSHDYIRSVRRPASQLYETVFGPLEDLLIGVQHLVIVPHLFWHYLSFHALYDSRRKESLLDRFEISYAPSASALNVCRGKQRLKRDKAVILYRNDGDLPHVETEGIAIGKVFDHATILRDSDAVLGKISSPAHPDVIHCACHAFFDPDQPFLSGIAIPPDSDDDRPTLLMDLLRLRLESSLVTLSACDTGLSCISNADELVGLSRGFFGAGAAALLLSLWKVADASTAYLMENFYWHYVANRQTKGRALQLAMQAVRAKPEFAHPYYWAPFVVMGEWG